MRDKKRTEEEQQQQHNQQQQQQFSQTKKEYRCYICGDRTHSINDCPQAGKPRAEWFVTKAINKIQASQREEDEDDESDENEERGRSRSATPHRQRRTSRGRQRQGRETVDQDWCTYQCIKDSDGCEKATRQVSFEQSNTHTSSIETKLLLDTGSTISCLLYTSPSPRDKRQSRMPSSA